MPRPVFPFRTPVRTLSLIRAGAAFGLVGLLAACAGNNADMGSSSELPVSQEAANYRAHAKSYYAPPGPPGDPWGPYIQEASSRFDVPEAWIRAVMQQESGGHLFDHSGNFITSTPGAMGLLQLMPPTYDDMRQQLGLGEDPYDPHDNILAGTAYLRQMYDIYGSPGFLAAYNDGPGSLDRYLRRGRPLPRETRRYVAAIGPHIAGIAPHSRSAADLLVAQHDPNSQVMLAQNTPPADVTPVTSPSERQAVSAAWNHREAAESTSEDAAAEPAPATVPETAPVQVASAAGSEAPTSISAAWAARGYAPTPERPPVRQASVAADDVADNRVTAQEIPIGHHLQPQPIMAVMPASRPQYHMSLPATSAPSRPVAATGNWAIQVGAFANARQASLATSAAHSKGGVVVASARSQVESVKGGRAHLYRARLTGLTHENAVAACRRLSHGSPCVVVPPGAY
ncbi:transglycosylase SLT domain-containing protein [Gluconobacter sp. Dm-62]|uniref:lytic transglycosylase domain-containing protein n=1 Tax=Gluconobacter sp. Dm-62 TaxID=2799804 RepID=UPI001B8D9389|nr:lytic transglycosylase domain-containing protein [Gluconobacter sp. Dm-62]MBS1103851.1 transglycosylase SLT domain-containing protein [Gluconobacter sp. Dm-62]